MAQLNQRRMLLALMGAGIVNVASGIWLMIASGGAFGPWMRSGMGRTLGIGGARAITALIIGMIMNPPAAKRLREIAAAAKRGGPPAAEEAAGFRSG